MSKNAQQAAETEDQQTAGGCFVRLVWMLLGNVLLAAVTMAIGKGGRSLSLADAAFWCLVAGMIALRYVDVKRLHGQTAMGKPATFADWRRYSIVLAAGAFVCWIIAHLVARSGTGVS